MGLSFSCADGADKTFAAPAENILKRSVLRGAPKDLLESLIKNTAPKAEGAEKLMPAPSVVISWVLQDVATFGFPQRPQATYRDLWQRDLQTEAHAARLRECWNQHGDAFPKAFAAELSIFLESLQDVVDFKGQTNKLVRVATLLAQVFASQNASFHVTRGSQELWPSVLAEIRRKHENNRQGAEWASPETNRWRQRIESLLHFIPGKLPNEVDSAGNTRRKSKNFVAMENAIKDLREAMSKVGLEVYKFQEKEKMEAKRKDVKASIKRAPWELESNKAAEATDS